MTVPAIKEMEAPKERFRVDTSDALAWFGTRLNQKRRAIEDLDTQYRAMRDQLERELASFEAHFMPQAELFVKRYCRKTGERSLKTLGGTFGYRLVRGGPRIEDKEQVTAWAVENLPEAVVADAKTKLDVERVKAHMAETGEVVPGAAFVDDEHRFYFRPQAKSAEEASA